MMWRWRGQLHDRIFAGAKFVDFAAITLDEAGCVGCDEAPQLFVGEERDFSIEAHMADTQGAGTRSSI